MHCRLFSSRALPAGTEAQERTEAKKPWQTSSMSAPPIAKSISTPRLFFTFLLLLELELELALIRVSFRDRLRVIVGVSVRVGVGVRVISEFREIKELKIFLKS